MTHDIDTQCVRPSVYRMLILCRNGCKLFHHQAGPRLIFFEPIRQVTPSAGALSTRRIGKKLRYRLAKSPFIYLAALDA